MPGMNGVEMSREIRKYEEGHRIQKTKIIAFSGNSINNRISEREEIMKSIDVYMRKPISFENLVNIVKN